MDPATLPTHQSISANIIFYSTTTIKFKYTTSLSLDEEGTRLENTTTIPDDQDETYFAIFKAMEHSAHSIFRLKKSLQDFIEEERNDVYLYTTIRYPPQSIPPTPT
jgi:hypothetical protein